MRSSTALIGLALQAGSSILSARSVLSCLWELTYRCNARCGICAYWQHPSARREEMPLADIRAGLHRVHDHGCRFINFTGGEPTLRPDLEDIVGAASGLGMWTSMVTNGSTVTRQRLRGLKQAGLDNLMVSLDSSDPGAHDAARGIPGLHAKVLRLGEWLGADFLSGHRTGGFMCVLSAANLHQAADMLRLAEQRGVYAIFQRYHPNKTGNLQPAAVFSDEDAAGILGLKRSSALLSSNGYLHGMVAPPADPPPCHAGRKYFSVDPYGRLHPCVDMPPVGHVLRDDFSVLRCEGAQQAVAACQGCWYCFRGESDSALRLGGAVEKATTIIRVVARNARRRRTVTAS